MNYQRNRIKVPIQQSIFGSREICSLENTSDLGEDSMAKKVKKILKNRMESIICNHCHKKIASPALVGLTLVCPHCEKSVNGQYYHHYINK